MSLMFVEALQAHQFELLLGLILFVMLKPCVTAIGRRVKQGMKARLYAEWDTWIPSRYWPKRFESLPVLKRAALFVVWTGWFLFFTTILVQYGLPNPATLIATVTIAALLVAIIVSAGKLIRTWRNELYGAWIFEAAQERWVEDARDMAKTWPNLNNRRCELLRKLENRVEELQDKMRARRHEIGDLLVRTTTDGCSLEAEVKRIRKLGQAHATLEARMNELVLRMSNVIEWLAHQQRVVPFEDIDGKVRLGRGGGDLGQFRQGGGDSIPYGTGMPVLDTRPVRFHAGSGF